MDELKLWCGAYGRGVFPVTVPRGAGVEALQTIIVQKYKQSHAIEVKLYLARSANGMWLKDGEDTDKLLRGDMDTQCAELHPTWKLSDPQVLGPNFQPRKSEIQILVGLSTPLTAASLSVMAGVGGDPQTLKDLIKSAMRKAMSKCSKKRSVYAISDLNEEQAARIMNKMRLEEEFIDCDEPVDTSFTGYPWMSSVGKNDVSQRAGCMEYLRLLLLKPLIDRGDFQMIDVADASSLLTIVGPRLPFRMNGTVDALLVNRRAKKAAIPLAGTSLVIELKENIESVHFAQALGQLVSSSLKVPLHCYPMSLLTDLNNHWEFAWFNEGHVLASLVLTYPKNAIDFIVAAVSEREGSIPFRVPFIDTALQRLKVDDFLPKPSDGADEMMERYELMADELDPEFLEERRQEHAHHLVRSMPRFAHMFD